MPRRLILSFFLYFLVLIPTSLAGQTTVTTPGGTTNAVPKFTGSATIGDSAITDNAGKVGIGTTTPAAKLAIAYTSGGSLDQTVSSNYGLVIRNTDWNSTQFTGIEFWNGSMKAVPTSRIISQMAASGNTGDNLLFQTQPDSATNPNPNQPTTKMMISSTGNVGIGTTSPAYSLDVNGFIKARSGFMFPDGSWQTTAAAGTITGVQPGSGLSGGGYAGNVSLAVDSTVARTNVSQSFTGNQVIYGNLQMGIANGSGGGFSANGGAWVSNNYYGTPFYIVCASLGGTCWAIDQYGNSQTAAGFTAYVVYAHEIDAAVKNFKIDNPGDPANKYMYHASVESSERKDYYDGVAVLDGSGGATVVLPSWFEVLNRDFRYSLTPIGAPAPDLYIAQEISKNQFTIAGGSPGLKVSWSITGVRNDPSAKANPLVVEVDKPDDEKGYYIDPEAYGQPASKSILQKKLGSASIEPPDHQ